MLRDVILSQRPMFLMQPSEIDYGATQYDLAGFTNYSYTNINKKSLVPHGWTTGEDTVYTNVFEIGSNVNQNRQFSIDIWSDSWNAPGSYFVSDNIDIYFYQDHVFMAARIDYDGTTNNYIFASAPVTSDLDVLHICGNFSNEAMSLVVNGVQGTPTQIPQDFTWSSANTTFTVGSNIASVAIFNRPSSLDEILHRFVAGNDSPSHAEFCANDQGDYWDMSINTAPVAGEIIIDKNDWILGSSHNVTVDREGRLTMEAPPTFTSYTKAGVEEALLTTSGGKVLLGNDHSISIPVSGYVSSSSGVMSMDINRSAGVAQVIWTLYNEKTRTALTLETNASDQVLLKKIEIDASGASVTTTTTYDSTIGTSATVVTWFEGDYIRLHTGGGSTAINQVSGQNSVYIPFNIGEETNLVLGGYYDYSSRGVTDLDNLYLYNYLPSGITNYDTEYKNADLATSYYTFLSDDGYGERKGTWTIRVSAPFEGIYAATYADWNGSAPEGGNSIAISYDSGAYNAITNRGQAIPSIPSSGTMGDVSIPNGPIDIKVTFASDIPFLEELRLVFIEELKTKSVSSDLQATFSSVDGYLYREAREPWQFSARGNYKFGTGGKVQFPSGTYQAIEFCGLGEVVSDSEVICMNNGTERNVRINAGTLTHTGFDAVYLNGEEVIGSATIVVNQPVHVVALLNSAVTSAFSIGHHTGSGGVPGGGIYSMSAYDYYINPYDHYASSRGQIRSYNPDTDVMLVTDTTKAPYLYALAWETTGATT